jgi:ABC-type Zn uptake system ZnuABC Zn-binding protein ZnuA
MNEKLKAACQAYAEQMYMELLTLAPRLSGPYEKNVRGLLDEINAAAKETERVGDRFAGIAPNRAAP